MLVSQLSCILMNSANTVLQLNSPSILISESPKTPTTSNTTQVRFYLPPPFSSSSSSQSSETTSPFTPLSANSSSKNPLVYSPITQICSHTDYANTPTVSQETILQVPKVPSRYHIMSDTDDDSFIDDTSTTNPDDIDNESSSINTTTDEAAASSGLSIVDLAASLIQDMNGNFNLSKEEEELIQGSTVNTKRYERSKWGVEDRFFETIEKHGDPQLQPLLPFITTNKGTERDRVFCFMLRGNKTEQKRIILSKCLLLCALKWRNITRKDHGEPLQPRTMAQLLKVLFSVFRKKHIKFNHLLDFNGDGEFHAVLKAQWELEKAKDPTYATGVRTSTFDFEADYKIREAYRSKRFDPLSESNKTSAYDDRHRYLVFVLGRYFLLRGRKELAFLMWKQLHFCEAHEEGKLVQYVELRHDWDKSHQIRLTNPTACDPNAIHPRIYPDETDELCPYKFLKFYRSLCAPSQERFFCQRTSVKQMKDRLANNQHHLYNEKNLWEKFY
jgi:hypothetical protein